MDDFIEDDLGDDDYGYGRRPKRRAKRAVMTVDRDQMDDLIGVFGENFLEEEVQEQDEDGERRPR